MAHDHSHHVRKQNQPEMNSPPTDGSRGQVQFEKVGRPEKSEHESHESETSRRSRGHDHGTRSHGGRGGGHQRFGDVVGAAVFADRMHMENRAGFRAEMHEIRHGVRDLMEEVEGGQLTAEQQSTFDGYVHNIVDLRDSFDFKNWRPADADVISARILERFGVEAAPSEAVETPEPATVDPTLRSQPLTTQVDTLAEAVSDQKPPTGTETAVTTEEIPPVIDTATPEVIAAVETEEVEPTSMSDTSTEQELSEMADRLAGVIADAPALMDDLLEALGV